VFDRRKIVQHLLARGGIRVDGSDPWDIRVKDPRFYHRVLRDGSLGLGESYMDGWWTCDRIDRLVRRLIDAGLDRRAARNWRLAAAVHAARLFNRQSRSRSRQVAKRHYDLGNDLFFAFLDPYRQYSCGFFNDGDGGLAVAQGHKMDLICRKMELAHGERVLDIGSGWGGLAKYMARHYGCEVTGVNISAAQLRFAREECRDLPVRFVHCDYRMEDWHNFGPDYDRTLMAWHRNFIAAWPELAGRYDERFRRMWEFYLLSCAGAFRARGIQLWQIVFTHRRRSRPACRPDPAGAVPAEVPPSPPASAAAAGSAG
jgi:cyclopropane fatty-acyl-phospholipid synthase-like methyltransferase